MKAVVVLALLLAAVRCSPDPAPVAIPSDDLAPATYQTVPAVTDPPFIADASGVPSSAAGADGIVVPPVAPAPAAVPGRCTQWEALLVVYAPPQGWDAGRMSRYVWRESRCDPSVRSRTRDSGLLQINDINLRFLRGALGEWVDRYTLLDPVQNVRAAAALCTYWANAGRSCYRPWSS